MVTQRHERDVVGREAEAVDSEENLTGVRAAPRCRPARVHADIVTAHDEIERLGGHGCGHGPATARPAAAPAGLGVAGAQRLISILPI